MRGKGQAFPKLPAAFTIVKPGETVTYTCPSNCLYSIITTDKGLLYLSGVEPGE